MFPPFDDCNNDGVHDVCVIRIIINCGCEYGLASSLSIYMMVVFMMYICV